MLPKAPPVMWIKINLVYGRIGRTTRVRVIAATAAVVRTASGRTWWWSAASGVRAERPAPTGSSRMWVTHKAHLESSANPWISPDESCGIMKKSYRSHWAVKEIIYLDSQYFGRFFGCFYWTKNELTRIIIFLVDWLFVVENICIYSIENIWKTRYQNFFSMKTEICEL